MNLTWKQLVICAATLGIAGFVGYKVLYSKASDDPNDQTDTVQKTNSIDKKQNKRQGRKKSKSDQIQTPSTEAKPLNDMQDMILKCELPVSELNKFSAEDKQRIFYALLMKGEMLMHQGPSELKKALEYFSKAISLVPNPGEVLSAFEKSLPPPVFNALLDSIQKDIQVKVEDYFSNLLPSHPLIQFNQIKFSNPSEPSKPLFFWAPVSKQPIAIGSTLWEETADVSALASQIKDKSEHCEHCLKLLDGARIPCPACNEFLYCSQQCCIKSSEIYHSFFCSPPEEVKIAVNELQNLCLENNNSMGLLLLRYVALLLCEELRGNGAANNGPFAHYDHLRPASRAPNSQDKQEAKLLRQIFSATSKNIVDFLTDEIYTSMKATIAKHAVTVVHHPGNPCPITRAECRQVADSHLALSLFHTSAHISHSCDPNVTMICEKTPRNARIVALKNIEPDTELTCSYLVFPSGTSKTERQHHLMNIFGIECKCQLCEEDLPIPNY